MKELDKLIESDIKDQIKEVKKKAEENDIRILQEENKRLNKQYDLMEQSLDDKQEIIDKAIEYIEKYVSVYDMEGDLRERLLNILKGKE